MTLQEPIFSAAQFVPVMTSPHSDPTYEIWAEVKQQEEKITLLTLNTTNASYSMARESKGRVYVRLNADRKEDVLYRFGCEDWKATTLTLDMPLFSDVKGDDIWVEIKQQKKEKAKKKEEENVTKITSRVPATDGPVICGSYRLGVLGAHICLASSSDRNDHKVYYRFGYNRKTDSNTSNWRNGLLPVVSDTEFLPQDFYGEIWAEVKQITKKISCNAKCGCFNIQDGYKLKSEAAGRLCWTAVEENSSVFRYRFGCEGGGTEWKEADSLPIWSDSFIPENIDPNSKVWVEFEEATPPKEKEPQDVTKIVLRSNDGFFASGNFCYLLQLTCFSRKKQWQVFISVRDTEKTAAFSR